MSQPESRIQPVRSLGEFLRLFAEGSAHGHLEYDTVGSSELRDWVENLIGWVSGGTIRPLFRTEQENWDAIARALLEDGLLLWVETAPAADLSAAPSTGVTAGTRTKTLRFHIAAEEPKAR